ncbi:hypothetical protein [Glycomyces paridis]|uniref:Uncharacterized protein n=1 Tax=Glycomyces paridis TaxID=2126555 RepID=A0A4S8PKN2_9ACTN|nr:hypothetical protein [Glycomyces paridis]THV30132.1 hypothetical protein E9998_07075 [Glycomyces paridis]
MTESTTKPVDVHDAVVRVLTARQLVADALDDLALAAAGLHQRGLSSWKYDTVVGALDERFHDLSRALANHVIHLDDGTKERDVVVRLREVAYQVRTISVELEAAAGRLEGVSATMTEGYSHRFSPEGKGDNGLPLESAPALGERLRASPSPGPTRVNGTR